MKSIAEIQAVISAGGAFEQAFLQALTPEERAEVGTFEHWSAKDTLAHIAFWRQQMAEQLPQLENPPEDPWEEDIDVSNQRVFDRYRDTSWEEVEGMLGESVKNLNTAVEQTGKEILTNPALDPYHGGHEPWRSVVGNGFRHPMSHLADYLVRQGHHKRALRLHEQSSSLLTPLDDSPDWRGVNTYNLACIFALLGEPENALARLSEAFPLAPRLVAWSKEDGDLVSLHGDPRFQALVQSYEKL